jgi:hypothetical protein
MMVADSGKIVMTVVRFALIVIIREGRGIRVVHDLRGSSVGGKKKDPVASRVVI